MTQLRQRWDIYFSRFSLRRTNSQQGQEEQEIQQHDQPLNNVQQNIVIQEESQEVQPQQQVARPNTLTMSSVQNQNQSQSINTDSTTESLSASLNNSFTNVQQTQYVPSRRFRRQFSTNTVYDILQVLVGYNNQLGQNRNINSNANLVSHLKQNNQVRSENVIQALEICDRGFFVPKEQQQQAYIDCPIRIVQYNFNVSAPHIYATMLENLNVKAGESVLDLGSGSGLVSAYLATLVGKQGKVVGLDIEQRLIKLSTNNINNLKKNNQRFNESACQIDLFLHNAFIPNKLYEKFDKIFVGACLPQDRIPQIAKYLKTKGGCIIAPVQFDRGQEIRLITQTQNQETRYKCIEMVSFSKLQIPCDAEVVLRAMELDYQFKQQIMVPKSTFQADIELIRHTLKTENSTPFNAPAQSNTQSKNIKTPFKTNNKLSMSNVQRQFSVSLHKSANHANQQIQRKSSFSSNGSGFSQFWRANSEAPQKPWRSFFRSPTTSLRDSSMHGRNSTSSSSIHSNFYNYNFGDINELESTGEHCNYENVDGNDSNHYQNSSNDTDSTQGNNYTGPSDFGNGRIRDSLTCIIERQNSKNSNSHVSRSCQQQEQQQQELQQTTLRGDQPLHRSQTGRRSLGNSRLGFGGKSQSNIKAYVGEYDCILAGCDFKIKAHKKILWYRCEHFRARFQSGMRDAYEDTFSVPEHFSQSHIQIFLHYVYHDQLLVTDSVMTVHLLHVAMYYGVPRLAALCEQELISHLLHCNIKVGAEMASQLLLVAYDHGLQGLTKGVVSYIANNFVEVEKTNSYQQLEKTELRLISQEQNALFQKQVGMLKDLRRDNEKF